MKEQSLDNFFDELVIILLKDLGFYIPSEIILDSALEELGDSLPDEFLNEMYVLDIHNGFGIFDIKEFNQRLITKRKFLENNIFKLLRKKGEVEEFEFIYIIEKYYDQLAFYFFITNWLKENLKLYNREKVNLATQGSFEIQHEYYKIHLKEFTRYFGYLTNISFKQHFNSAEFVKEYIPDMISRYGLVEEPSKFKIESEERNEHKTGSSKSSENLTIVDPAQTKKIKKKSLLQKMRLNIFY